MRQKYVNTLSEGDVITESFLIENKSLATARNGKSYINLTLRDKTGNINAKVWDDADIIFSQLGSSQFAEVSGFVESFQGKPQLKVTSIKSLKPEKVDMSDFIATTTKDIEKMFKDLRDICSSVKDKNLYELLAAFLSDEELVEKFKKSPAAKSIHHTYIGGLLEHTLSIMQICDKLASHFGSVNRDLLLTGAFFHDIGKIAELETGKTFDYTTEGSLIGHVAIGYRMVETAIAKIKNFPDKLRMELGHLILSHQGKLEFGAPVLPKCAEALILHYADDCDVRINIFKRALESAKNTDSDFTDHMWELGGRVYKGVTQEIEE
jgi:3'-5' exoribonuclease